MSALEFLSHPALCDLLTEKDQEELITNRNGHEKKGNKCPFAEETCQKPLLIPATLQIICHVHPHQVVMTQIIMVVIRKHVDYQLRESFQDLGI
ncbi:NAP1-related protein 2-like [Canna indica]|uniref:NAP1-related protein 2-like n=1 Tax=Canna indica TaxID=4628 RepID=A0AAQ3QIN6_9LILI|nr:NAP1-related protein 2-like [Canna indica]